MNIKENTFDLTQENLPSPQNSSVIVTLNHQSRPAKT